MKKDATARMGWLCPACGKSNAPTVKECACGGIQVIQVPYPVPYPVPVYPMGPTYPMYPQVTWSSVWTTTAGEHAPEGTITVTSS